jgi:hypothetical protein
MNSGKSFAICSGETFTYHATSAVQGVSFSWERLANSNINDGKKATGSGADIIEVLRNNSAAPVTATYRFTLSNSSCSSARQENVTVVVNPEPAVAFVSSVSACQDAHEVQITYPTVVVPGTLQYKLTFSDEAIKQGFRNLDYFTELPENALTIPVPSNVTPGTYRVDISVKNGSCTTTVPVYISLFARIQILTHPESILNVCSGELSELSLVVEAVGYDLRYQWYRNDQALSGANAAVYYPSQEGKYFVEVTSSCGSALRSKPATVTVNAFSIERKWDDVLYLRNDNLHFVSYQWYKNGYPIVKDANSQYFTDPDGLNGTYYVRAYYADGSYTETCPIVIHGVASVSKVYAYPNPLMKGNVLKVHTGVQEGNAKNSRIIIYNIMGEMVYQGVASGSETEIPTTLRSGKYVLKVVHSLGVKTQLLIVE